MSPAVLPLKLKQLVPFDHLHWELALRHFQPLDQVLLIRVIQVIQVIRAIRAIWVIRVIQAWVVLQETGLLEPH